jgi:hypothetical protein
VRAHPTGDYPAGGYHQRMNNVVCTVRKITKNKEKRGHSTNILKKIEGL